MKSVLFHFFILTTIICALSSCNDTQPIATGIAADFTFEIKNQTAPAEVEFTNMSLNATSYLWDFGDGTFSTKENPTHTFEFGDNFKVTLTAKSNGISDSITKSFSIGHKYTSIGLKVWTVWKMPLKNKDGEDWDPDGLIDYYSLLYDKDYNLIRGNREVHYSGLSPTLPLGNGFTELAAAIPIGFSMGDIAHLEIWDYDLNPLNDQKLGEVDLSFQEAARMNYPEWFTVKNEGLEVAFQLVWSN